jgi:hypothetical protein
MGGDENLLQRDIQRIRNIVEENPAVYSFCLFLPMPSKK